MDLVLVAVEPHPGEKPQNKSSLGNLVLSEPRATEVLTKYCPPSLNLGPLQSLRGSVGGGAPCSHQTNLYILAFTIAEALAVKESDYKIKWSVARADLTPVCPGYTWDYEYDCFLCL